MDSHNSCEGSFELKKTIVVWNRESGIEGVLNNSGAKIVMSCLWWINVCMWFPIVVLCAEARDEDTVVFERNCQSRHLQFSEILFDEPLERSVTIANLSSSLSLSL